LRFPGPTDKWPISTGGGTNAVWSRARHELLYLAADGRIMMVSYTAAADAFQAEKPRVWSETPVQVRPSIGASFDLHPDGERVVMAPGTAAMAGPTARDADLQLLRRAAAACAGEVTGTVI
jgi:hypothetical protein